MAAYYSENNPYAAAWLRSLVAAQLIPDGQVDDRSIVDIVPEDLAGFTQCHFFAGLAGWSLALRLANWEDSRPCWTGSAPCQPLSVAGKGLGVNDPRHLWPEFYRLIAAVKPPVIFGEQVASRMGREWMSNVRLDLQASGYDVAAFDVPAAAVGAPHIRQRLYWTAEL